MNSIIVEKDKRLKLLLARVHNLPTPPVVFEQITKVINDPDTSAYQIAGIVSEDPALTVKILKLTNSSFYGIPRTVTSVKQATVILGLEVVKSLIISASVFEVFSKKGKLDGAFLEDFWRHSLAAAFMARIISRRADYSSAMAAELSFAAGLLHDIGKLVIVTELPEEHLKIKSFLEHDTSLPVYDAENQVLGFSHGDVGSFLASKWNLPESLCEAIGNHHRGEIFNEQTQSAMVHLASYLAHRMDAIDEIPPNLSPIFKPVWPVLNISPDHESALLELLKNDYGKAETFINMAKGIV